MKVEIRGISEVIKSLKSYQRKVPEKLHVLIEKLGNEGIRVARIRLDETYYSGDDSARINEIVWVSETEAKIIADGDKVLFMEFGSGRRQPEHPQGALLGMTHGSYAKATNALRWVYAGELGDRPAPMTVALTDEYGNPLRDKYGNDLILTQGNPPGKFMYSASRQMREKFEEIVREVFK